MRFRVLALLALAALLATSLAASAHGRVCLQADGAVLDRGGHGKAGPSGATGDCPDADLVEFVIGWTDEPPFAGVKNGLDLAARMPSNNTPIENVTTLQGKYEFGGKSFPLEIRPQFGRAGWYTDEILPSRPGEYKLHIWGTIATTAGVKQVNFTTHPAHVEPLSDVTFPAQEKSAEVTALEARVKALEDKLAALQASIAKIESGMSKSDVTPKPPAKGAPGFEAALALGVLAAGAWALRRRQA